MKNILEYQSLLYTFKIIYFQLISYNYNNSVTNNFEIKKIKKLIVKNYYQLNFYKAIKSYLKGYKFCLTSKIIYFKSYKDFFLNIIIKSTIEKLFYRFCNRIIFINW